MFTLGKFATVFWFSLLWTTWGTRAAAELGRDCGALGQAMVEHSCFHAEFGPFVSVAGTPGEVVTSSTPNLDAVHTEYRVGLPLTRETHVVTYTSQRSGSWAVFSNVEVPLVVSNPEGDELGTLLVQRRDTGCDALPVARAFSLVAKERYTLRLGPTPDPEVILVIEYADDFLVSVGPDRDGDGFGSREDGLVTNCAPPTGYAPNATDCDDADPEVNPAAVERCDDLDQNCNGSSDDVGLQCRAGAGACLAVGVFTCDGEVAECDATPTAPGVEVCNGVDDDCDAVIDDGGDELCGSSDKPRCVRHDFVASCGCLLDSDCGAIDSGRICDVARATCHEGCSGDVGRNGCPEGFACQTEGGTETGACVALPEAAEPREPQQTGRREVTAPTRGEGCQCALGLGPNRPSGWGLGVCLTTCWLLLRRKRAVALASCALAWSGCGGKTRDDSTTSNASRPCTQQLGSKPVQHACSHTTNGPFENVIATTATETAPNVDKVHVTYEVETSSDSDAFVAFTPTRQGEHLLLLDRELALSVTASGERQQPVFVGPVDECPTVSYGEVYTFQSSVQYLIDFDAGTESPLLLFFEHLATFGDGAWQERCVDEE